MKKKYKNYCRVTLNKQSKKYYIVLNGREIGILDNYDDVKKLTDKFSNSVYKRCDDYSSAAFEFKEYSFLNTPSPHKKLENNPPEFGYKILINKVAEKHEYLLLNIETGKIDYTSLPLRFPIEYIPFIAVFDYFTKINPSYQEGLYLDDFYCDVECKFPDRRNAKDFFMKYEPIFIKRKELIERYYDFSLSTFLIDHINQWDYEEWGELSEIMYY